MNELVETIAAEIKNRGVITFAEFMQMALYCPNLGFYEREKDRIGRRGEFFTSVSVGKSFGALLAFQFAEWLREIEGKTPAARMREFPFQLVEAGAHRGDLARDILRWLRQRRPDLFGAIQYSIIEPSEKQQQWQRAALAEFNQKVRWLRTMAELGPICGVIFSNELLDAMPVHRLSWERSSGQWLEWGVEFTENEFRWTRLARPENSNRSSEPPIPPEMLEVLPDGFVVDVCSAAEDWWGAAARSLRSGRLLTIDYGFALEELLAPERSKGTLRAYRQQRVSVDVLAAPGEQDITAHINFTSLQDRGETAGLKTELLTTQARFLGGIVSAAHAAGRDDFNWPPHEVRQVQTLMNPEHLGHSFRVLVQSRA